MNIKIRSSLDMEQMTFQCLNWLV
ncbi:hypothetical protein CGLO_12842 [Colletotrichum gloeosporioides Cg-14]|uniref:PLAT domain-containing protein n=1 Tax=Colletotrichum gloeosporioides (strain Cg-14) TaxID=1237896 RepID=T0K4T5_COLGC|nr:hypothetical protein CGLO_12842 [Colletotrichum gloeosporioides Cg-14]